MSGEEGGCWMTGMPWLAKNTWMECAVCAGALSWCSAQAPSSPPVSVASCKKQQVSDISKLVDKTAGLQFGLVEHTHNEQCPPYQRKQWVWLWLLTALSSLSLALGNQQTSTAKTDVSSLGHTRRPTSRHPWWFAPLSFHLTLLPAACLLPQTSAIPSVRRWEFVEQILQQHVACSNLASLWPDKFHKTIPCPRERGSSRTPPYKTGVSRSVPTAE